MRELEGKRALITGGTRGLGRATALGFARAGAKLALNYRRDEQSAAATLAEVRALSPQSILVKADLEDEAQVRAMVARAADEFGALDIYIANAAATAFKPLLQTKPHNLSRTFNLSLGSFVAASQELSRVMVDGGRIAVVSGFDSVRYMEGHGALGAAKAALESIVRYLAFELGPRGITVRRYQHRVVRYRVVAALFRRRFPACLPGRDRALGAAAAAADRGDRRGNSVFVFAGRKFRDRSDDYGRRGTDAMQSAFPLRRVA